MRPFTEIEKKILNRIQRDIIITETPYKVLSKEIGIDEDELLGILKRLKENNFIRDICAIFNAKRLGYNSTLVTFEISEDNIPKAAHIINEHPGVSHNYQRDHKYNIWFTIAVDEKISLERTVYILASRCNAHDYLILRNEKLFKINLFLESNVNIDNEINSINFLSNNQDKISNKSRRDITDEEKNAIILLQMDLPLDKRPFENLIERENSSINETSLIKIGESLKRDGSMRRYSAILKHNNIGYTYNAMTAWKINNIDTNSNIFKIFAIVPNISHLYLRTLYPGKWEHPLFAMIHATSNNELNRIIKYLEEKSGISDYLVLNTLKEFKKQRVEYFTKKF